MKSLCNHIRKLLIDLGPEGFGDHSTLHAHLDNCDKCRVLYKTLSEMEKGTGYFSQSEVMDLIARRWQNLEQHEQVVHQRRFGIFPRFRTPYLLLTILALGLLISLFSSLFIPIYINRKAQHLSPAVIDTLQTTLSSGEMNQMPSSAPTPKLIVANKMTIKDKAVPRASGKEEMPLREKEVAPEIMMEAKEDEIPRVDDDEVVAAIADEKSKRLNRVIPFAPGRDFE